MRTTLLVAALTVVGSLGTTALADHHAEASSDWTILFDGTSLDAWKGYNTETIPDGWVVEDGVLVNRSSEVDLVSKETFADFELRFHWKIDANGNSGVIYRCDEKEGASYMTGPEYQVLDNAGWEHDPFDPHSAGALYGLYPVSEDAARSTSEWNTGRIVVQGGKVEHWMNGKLVVSAEIGSSEWNERVSKTKFNGWKRFGSLNEGHIALQAHRGKDGVLVPVSFRDVKIRRLGEGSH